MSLPLKQKSGSVRWSTAEQLLQELFQGRGVLNHVPDFQIGICIGNPKGTRYAEGKGDACLDPEESNL